MYEYLICAGVMKAGTTLLYSHLVKHHQVRLGGRKELHYFDTVEQPDKAQYDGLFADGDGIKMDISPFYMYYGASIERMAEVLDPKKVAVVVLLRDPVERAFSHYRMRKSQQMEDQPFEACFDLEAKRTARSFHDLQLFSYFTRGFYAAQLDRLYRVFPKENIRLYLFEDFVSRQQDHIDDICDFVGIERVQVKDIHENKTVVHVKSRRLNWLVRKLTRLVPKRMISDWMRKARRWVSSANERKDIKDTIDPAFERKLVDYYLDDVLRLKEQYGLDVSKWKHFAGYV